ncbi:hypothetical protein VPH35_012140 [Triticum aestivum]|uniref:Uncharacterized protein n=1 Tax=Aegilops tauschii TaxID=37682 RepID=M8BJS3_AEGTA
MPLQRRAMLRCLCRAAPRRPAPSPQPNVVLPLHCQPNAFLLSLRVAAYLHGHIQHSCRLPPWPDLPHVRVAAIWTRAACGWARASMRLRKIWKQTALSFVINSSHTKWKDWKSDLKRHKFDAALIDAQLMKRHESRISEAD